jgi:hypothetical protein
MGHRRISRHTFLKFSNQMAPAAVMDDQSVDGGATLYALPIIKYIQYMNEYLSSKVHQGRSIFKCAVQYLACPSWVMIFLFQIQF